MADLTYNEFRALHKGISQGEMSELWNKYKEGEYQPDADNDGIHDSVDDAVELEETSLTGEEETEESEAEVEEDESDETEDSEEANVELLEEEEVVEEEPELTPEELYKQNLQHFAESYRALQFKHKLAKDQVRAHEVRLVNVAKATRPLNYSVKPEDGWQLWVGPHPEALLVNERNQIAFCITRTWWSKNYQGSFMVQDMVLDDPNRLASIRERYRKKGKLVLRCPIPGIEIKLPSSKLEAVVTSSHSYEG